MTTKYSDIAKKHALWLFTAGNILASRSGKKFIHDKNIRFTNMDNDFVHDLFISSFSRRSCLLMEQHSNEFELDNDMLNQLATKARDAAHELCERYDLKIRGIAKKRTYNDDTIAPACYEIADELTSNEWYKNYPSGDYTREFPENYFKILEFLSAFGHFLYAMKTLKLDTGLPKYERFLQSLSPLYITNSGYLSDLIVADAIALKKNPNLIIRYNATYPSSGICTTVTSDDANFVYVDYRTGKTHGESRAMFSCENWRLQA